MLTATLLQELLVAVATRVPVAPAAASCCHAASEETWNGPLVPASQASNIPAGAVKVEEPAHAPPNASIVFGTVVVIDGAVTERDFVDVT